MASDEVVKEAKHDLEGIDSHPLARVSDEARLEQLGHKQELDRGFSVVALGSLVMCLMATWEALSTVIAPALVSGGPPCLFYNYILAIAGTMAIVLSLAEIASIYPTAGGQYHWVAVLAPQNCRTFASWATGWISVGGQFFVAASAAFAAGLQLQSLIVITNESYDRPRWQGMIFYWAVVIYSALLNLFGVRLLPGVNVGCAVIHIVGLVAIMITLGVMSDKNSSDFVFTEVVNSSGWESTGVSWLIGLQSVVFPMLGYDAACHMAEELPNATRNVPLAMIGGVGVNGILGFAYTILLLYSTSPLEALLETPTGFPFMQIFLDATRSEAGAIIMSLIPSIIAVAASIAGMASTSRTIWAFARDGGLPFSEYFSHVDSRFKVPLRAIGVTTVFQILIGLLYLGNVTAFNALLSLAIVGSHIAHVVPIWYMTLYGRPKLPRSHYGAFSLPKVLGYCFNGFSMIWIAVVIVFSMFPLTLPVSPANMNYTSVVLAGWCVFGIAYYYIGQGKENFRVPYRDQADEYQLERK